MKQFFKIILWLLIAVASMGVLLITFLTVTEYRPADVETVEVTGQAAGVSVPAGKELCILSWNVGYAALGKDADFILDGGGKAPVSDEETVISNLKGIAETLQEQEADVCLLQEADSDSFRSYREDFRTWFGRAQNTYAMNYSCPFVPFPWPPLGRVNSGLLTVSDYDISSAERISLQCPFSWPVRTANLKRCLLVSRLPVEGTGRELVLVDLHLEAYESGEGKIAQTEQLKAFLQSEYEKGNYVIAAGDFNQRFPGTDSVYPPAHPDLWEPGRLEESSIPEGFTFAFDPSTPTCRLLNQPYDPADTANTQYFVIDGAILSPNVRLQTVETLDEGFVFSDHNPVRLTVVLEDENAAPSTVPDMTEEQQKQLLMDRYDEWAFTSPYESPWYYAFSDLDHNGRMEVTAAIMQGSGLYTWGDIWEISGDYSGITRCELMAGEGTALPDIITDQVPCYYDNGTGRYYYVYEDITRDGAARHYDSYVALCLHDGMIDYLPLAIRETVYESEDRYTVTCENAAGVPITEAEYGAIADTYFAGLEKTEAAVEWTMVENPAE